MTRFLPALFFALSACSAFLPPIPVDSSSVNPGTQVMRGNDTLELIGTPIKIGDPLPSVPLFNKNLQSVDLSKLHGEVLLISMVPSLDTQVCERQTRVLAEGKRNLSEEVQRVTISRDLPFAQKRFADALPGSENILFLSDFAEAKFGRSTGLLMDQIHLLARAVLVVDRQGIVRYLQVVPTINHLPDLGRAIDFATQLSSQ